MSKVLGKIQKVSFGIGGYNDSMLGISFHLSSGLGNVIDSARMAYDPSIIKVNERTKWSESDRDKQLSDIMRFISDILNQAKVDNINDLVGKPVEIEFDGMMLLSWRILTEVL